MNKPKDYSELMEAQENAGRELMELLSLVHVLDVYLQEAVTKDKSLFPVLVMVQGIRQQVLNTDAALDSYDDVDKEEMKLSILHFSDDAEADE